MAALVSAVLVAATTTGRASTVDVAVFAVAAAVVLLGAIGVVISRNPVHAALMLVMTLFGIAVLFLLQRDDFLAVVQVIVYAGAIVVLFLFVIMFLGIDREESIWAEPLKGQRPLALILGMLGAVGLLVLGQVSKWTTGAHSVAGSTSGSTSNVAQLGKSVYTTYLFPFEITAALLVIAVVGAVVLARRPPPVSNPTDEEAPVLPADAIDVDETEVTAGSGEASTPPMDGAGTDEIHEEVAP